MANEVDCKESSTLRWARYDEAARTLEVDFRGKDGSKVSTYQYYDFSPESWAQFNAASDKGRHFAFFIRPRYDKSKAYRKTWDRKMQEAADAEAARKQQGSLL